MGQGYGFGKVILTGEHFVVAGNHAIVCGINSKTTATVEHISSNDYELVDNRIETSGYKKEKFEQQKESLELIFKALNLTPEQRKVRIMLAGDLVAASGVGASAANCAAIARAFKDEFKLGLNDEEINAVAFQGEMGYHGTPSGIDNTAAVFGGLLWYQKGTPPKFEKIECKNPVEIVIGDTGLIGDTKTLVLGVTERRQNKPEKYNKIFEEAEQLANQVRVAMKKGDERELAKLLNRNQELLREIGVSHPKLEELIEIALENGATAAKLTGGGGGGLMIALTPGNALRKKVAQALQEKGFRTYETTVG